MASIGVKPAKRPRAPALGTGLSAPGGTAPHAGRRAVDRLNVAWLTALLTFGALAFAVVRDPVRKADHDLFGILYSGDWLRPEGSVFRWRVMSDLLPLFDRLADLRTLALLGAGVIVVALLREDRRGAAVAAGALLVIAPVGAVVSNVLDRPAPYPVEGSGSFPSGHATAAAVLVLCAALLARPGRERIVVGCAGCALLLAAGLSVVADGGHWPGDVIGGWLLALAGVAGLFALSRAAGARGAQTGGA
jgi:membrane-associated phospholipid phosphatase